MKKTQMIGLALTVAASIASMVIYDGLIKPKLSPIAEKKQEDEQSSFFDFF